ncbi:aminotransferase class V [Idiomarina tyrosinivorans]|uniref:cysteine desulfurase n=2 Tax=Idiomarina tyrosinivorans TaxID=1445662 RepID=A0A432ZPF6_9GAMM|nr:aminotransferase class V [Idiomarina tyrosinivorans]
MAEPLKNPESYLDCNATTPVLAPIADAVSRTMRELFGNPSSSHITGLKARYILEDTRNLARQVIAADSGKLLFNSGATEGIQTAVLSALIHAKQQPMPEAPVLLYGATEHKAVPQALEHWNKLLDINAELVAIPVNRQGLLDLSWLAQHLPRALMVCTMAVNNETGVYQDLTALEQLIRQHRADVPWLVDCVQALGKMPLQMSETSIDYATFSGHKLYGPKGVGFLYVRDQAPYTPLMIGGGQEAGDRSGTENLPGISALRALFKLMLDPQQTLLATHQRLEDYRQRLLNALQQAFPNLVVNHPLNGSVPTTLNFSVAGLSSTDIMNTLDACQVRVSSGSACSSGVSRSFVLDAMGLENWRSESAIRLSFGPAMTDAELALACQRIETAGNALRESCLVVADTHADSEQPLNGVVQLRQGNQCCYLVIDQQAQEMVVIDPHPALAQRIENLVKCRGYSVNAVLSTAASETPSATTWLNPLLTAQSATDALGWPESAAAQCDQAPLSAPQALPGCIKVGQRRLWGYGTQQRGYVLSEPVTEQPLAADFLFPGKVTEAPWLAPVLAQQPLVCPAEDGQWQIVLTACEWTQGCEPATQPKLIPVTHNEAWLNDESICVLDVRDSQEALLNPIQAAAEVINVPLNSLPQFIYQNRANKAQHYVCLCRSGKRSEQVSQVLQRHGFSQVEHLQGGVALLGAVEQSNAKSA